MKNFDDIWIMNFGLILIVSLLSCTSSVSQQAKQKIEADRMGFALTHSQIIKGLGLETGHTSVGIHSPNIKNPHVLNAFFCRLEARLEESSPIPVRMRLGGLEYVNSLENKNPFNRIQAKAFEWSK